MLKLYWPLRDDISVEDGLILLGSRVIVPECLRGKILQQIHGGHFGIHKCKLGAKSCVYWPYLYLTNRFHVAVHLFSYRSQMTSKCGKNKKVAREA